MPSQAPTRPTVRQLEYLVAVAEHGSFRRAAAACRVTQPALSAQIQELERNLGLRVFERTTRRVLATAAGEALLARARAALAAVDELAEEARVRRTPLTGVLRLGVIPTVAPYLLPRALPLVRRRHPGLRIQLREDFTEPLVQLARDGRLDLLLLALEAELADLQLLPLFPDPFLLAVPALHPLAQRRLARERDLDQEVVLLLDDGH